MLCKVFWSICSNFFKFDFDQDLWLRILFWFLQARIRFIFDQKATIISIRQCPIELIRKLYCMQWYRFFFSTDPPRNRRNFFAYIRTQNRRIRLKYNYFLSHEYLNDTLNVLITNLFTEKDKPKQLSEGDLRLLKNHIYPIFFTYFHIWFFF